MSKITEFLDKQEGYNIECILENKDFKLAVIALLKDFEKQLTIHSVVVPKNEGTFYCRNDNTSYKDPFCEMSQCDDCKKEEALQ